MQETSLFFFLLLWAVEILCSVEFSLKKFYNLVTLDMLLENLIMLHVNIEGKVYMLPEKYKAKHTTCLISIFLLVSKADQTGLSLKGFSSNFW